MFKIGDKVRFLGRDGMSAKIGATATVYDVSKYLYVRWDRNELSEGQNDGGYWSSDFELAKKEIDWFALNGMFS